jgi:hypothetical protein
MHNEKIQLPNGLLVVIQHSFLSQNLRKKPEMNCCFKPFSIYEHTALFYPYIPIYEYIMPKLAFVINEPW